MNKNEKIEKIEREDAVLIIVSLTIRVIIRSLITWGVMTSLSAAFGSQFGIIGGLLISWGVYALVMVGVSEIMREVFGYEEGLQSSLDGLVALIEYFGKE